MYLSNEVFMIWVYVIIGVGAAVILAWVIIDYLNQASILRPMVGETQTGIGQSEEDFKAEESTIDMVEKEIGNLKTEVAGLEGNIGKTSRKIEELKLKKQRRAPTSKKL